ncbi:AMZ family class C beta-lactamase [Achromobacter sp. Root170]|jgi:beta-lactamase class C|uniref:AMZ family class C beta-lactamase n=1 Tax=Achromobacter sp. Root170 TaxID=1736480 RepID=UPI0006FB4252|nr:AMZ family class C beta-lactamase [Achromobacter sp. Root170]KRB12136.1 class C beta-lactamase [Achromobacter sp. Root170]
MFTRRYFCASLLAAGFLGALPSSAVARSELPYIDSVVNEAARSVIRQHDIAGMVIAVTHQGRQRFYTYGVESLQTRRAVNRDTIFEVGSISKTFTVTLAAYAQAKGLLQLTDSPARFLPELAGTEFAKLTLLNLATHTTGGFPLQVPDEVRDNAQLMQYLKAWKPEHAPGTYRSYANPSIGMLGVVAAASLKQPFAQAMEKDLFPKLGLSSTFIEVPAAKASRYAQGYNKQGAPVRVNPGVLAAEAYGVKTSARDLLRFVEASMDMDVLDKDIRRAIADTHVGYYQVGAMTQDMVWEQFPYPVPLDSLLTANAGTLNSQSHPAQALQPPLAPQAQTWINKTGSTNGFGAYVAFVPARKLGIVILANRNYPNDARVRLAAEILGAVDKEPLAPAAAR